MARAFFYAGARALLVSHWEVGSDAAVKLTTRAFAELKSNPHIGRANEWWAERDRVAADGAVTRNVAAFFNVRDGFSIAQSSESIFSSREPLRVRSRPQ